MRRAAIVTGAALLVAVGCRAVPLTILYTNDLHLRFERLDSIERIVAGVRETGASVLLVDGGDAWQDFRRPLLAVWGADEMVEWMTRVGYDGMALGNHDTYWGPGRLAELAEEAGFPILCANWVPVPPGAAPFVPSARVETGPLSVLLIGLVTDEWIPYSAYPAFRAVGSAIAVREEIRRRSSGSDLIVVVAHLPVADAVSVATAVPEIDVFVTGHSHERTRDPVRVGETLIVQSGQFGEDIGRLVVDVDPEDGEHRFIANELVPTEKAPIDIGRSLVRLAAIVVVVVATVLVALS